MWPAILTFVKWLFGRGPSTEALERVILALEAEMVNSRTRQREEVSEVKARLLICEHNWDMHLADVLRVKELVATFDLAHTNAIVIVDQNRVILEWNEAATKLFQWTREEAVGRGVSFLSPPDFPAAAPRSVRPSGQGEEAYRQLPHESSGLHTSRRSRTIAGRAIELARRRQLALRSRVHAAGQHGRHARDSVVAETGVE